MRKNWPYVKVNLENLGGGSLLGHDPIINDFRKVIEEMRREEIKQQKDEKMRLSNIIIHRAGESYDENKNPRTNDKILLDTFLQKIETDVNVKSFFRIGKPAEKKTSASGCLKGISVTEDFTIEEREIVQKFAKDVKTKITKERTLHTYGEQWAHQKTGNMCLVRFPKHTN